MLSASDSRHPGLPSPFADRFVEIDQVDKVYPLPNGERYVALKGIDLTIRQGEFVSLIGHSGCGKSTLLNIVAGLDRPSIGGVVLEGREVKQPGPDRMVVFQNYSLLPWKTVRGNIALGVNTALKDRPAAERRQLVEAHIQRVGLTHAAHKYPHELSGGMKQRVAIARALALQPQMLLLDEPFGALDALTRGNLQDQLMQICQEHRVTCLMVTHDVDEALLLSDRVVMLTNGPAAHISQVLEVPIPRPRHRLEVMHHPSYYALRGDMVYFLNQQKRQRQRRPAVAIRRHGLEKVNLDLGFVPLTDCAPLVVAKEKGFFQQVGLDEVTLSREPSWHAIAEGLTAGRLDGAAMVAGMPLALTLGMGGSTPVTTVTALVLSRNGNAITLKRSFLDAGIHSVADLCTHLDHSSGQQHTLGIVHPASMHNLLLRYWLASGGIVPDRDVTLTSIPPAQMVASLKAGEIDGYCAGEPWNNWAVQEDLGYVIATTQSLWRSHPEKVLGVREDWTQAHPQTYQALVQALLLACEYCDDPRNREEILGWLGRPEYVGTDAIHLRPGFIDPYAYGPHRSPEALAGFNQFARLQSTAPRPAEGAWLLSQLARWNLIPFPKNWVEILERVYRPDLYAEALHHLGRPDMEPSRSLITLFDGMVFSPDDPLGYLYRLDITHPFTVAEFPLDRSIPA